ncbi:MAG: hypothetical protein IT288_18530 [Bdellovibrionales bacterium]|nr:hypothetical protein [Bdellovibrionales bacterium]
MILIALFLSQVAFAMNVNPAPFPVFLKEGFSSILEFEEAPTQVVLGDQNLFQVEKLERSIVIKPLVPYATTNMFVYFKKKEARLFILTASEDNEPTYFKKFTSLIPSKPTTSATRQAARVYGRKAVVHKSVFDRKKDFLTVDFEISADASAKITPDWDRIRLKHKDRYVSPSKLWSERREIQRDSTIKARLIFTKPNIPLDMRDVSLVVPVKGSTKPFLANLKAGR